MKKTRIWGVFYCDLCEMGDNQGVCRHIHTQTQNFQRSLLYIKRQGVLVILHQYILD